MSSAPAHASAMCRTDARCAAWQAHAPLSGARPCLRARCTAAMRVHLATGLASASDRSDARFKRKIDDGEIQDVPCSRQPTLLRGVRHRHLNTGGMYRYRREVERKTRQCFTAGPRRREGRPSTLEGAVGGRPLYPKTKISNGGTRYGTRRRTSEPASVAGP